MLVRQLFYHPTSSYTYLVADSASGDAVLIDPVKEKVQDYVQLCTELGLTAVAAIDTHYHNDRPSGSGELAELWGCEAIAGVNSDMPGLTRHVEDGDTIQVGSMQLQVLHTPGHSDDSYCYLLEHAGKSAVFTGDTLLVRSVGLSDQATSNPQTHYHSLFDVLAKLPDDTLVYPGRDFKGWPLGTIGEEKHFNPYLLAADMAAFLALKDKQKPTDIQPLAKSETVAEKKVESTAAAADPGNSAGDNEAGKLGNSFFLPDEKRIVDSAAPEKKRESEDALKNRDATESDDDSSSLDDSVKVPTWR